MDLNGTRSLHGPIYAEPVSSNSGPVAQSRTLGQMSQALALAASTAPAAAQVTRVLTMPRPLIPVASAGIVRVAKWRAGSQDFGLERRMVSGSRNQLVAAGLPPGSDARFLQLYAEGVEQPLLILGKQSGLWCERQHRILRHGH